MKYVDRDDKGYISFEDVISSIQCNQIVDIWPFSIPILILISNLTLTFFLDLYLNAIFLQIFQRFTQVYS